MDASSHGARPEKAAPDSAPPSLLQRAVSAAHSYCVAAQALVYGTLQRVLVKALSMGPLPRHIAFIMDGNRRWSRANGKRVFEGHRMGFQALRRVLELCMALEGVYMVTVYAFAIDNFKRDPEEVDALMDLAKTRLLELYDHGYVILLIQRGGFALLDVQEAVQRLEEATQYNTGAILNICMPYSAQDEICHALSQCVEQKQPFTREAVESHLMVAPEVPVDLLVRTSSVHRLSDFLLWQCNERTQLHFVQQYWPLFGARELIPILLQYQRERLWRKDCWTRNDLPSQQSSGR